MQPHYIYSLDYIRKAIQDRQPARVCEATGIARHTLYRLRDNKGVPSYDTVKALSDYLMQADD